MSFLLILVETIIWPCFSTFHLQVSGHGTWQELRVRLYCLPSVYKHALPLISATNQVELAHFAHLIHFITRHKIRPRVAGTGNVDQVRCPGRRPKNTC